MKKQTKINKTIFHKLWKTNPETSSHWKIVFLKDSGEFSYKTLVLLNKINIFYKKSKSIREINVF